MKRYLNDCAYETVRSAAFKSMPMGMGDVIGDLIGDVNDDVTGVDVTGDVIGDDVIAKSKLRAIASLNIAESRRSTNAARTRSTNTLSRGFAVQTRRSGMHKAVANAFWGCWFESDSAQFGSNSYLGVGQFGSKYLNSVLVGSNPDSA